ncbi:Abi family protein [Companilactobacillus nodensis]|uniref:Abi-like protein n=1 Tax=Companilactobacillus nodensis DSM 19682 = JCM 14932 = NBRC 107160 TaxID=1423775 RepID=A0A0R1KJ30_9LACO|nr:Abi family protein [Companilactobacillus nodensis]KRK79031.1 Abi-like protein [Companilactobacillus nodensis DSM 19682 = JCM 14932 = NBRC 107160]
MIEPKPFKSYNQQLKILRERGMDIPKGYQASKVIKILELENYYSVINGYKDIFLERDPVTGSIVKPEIFKNGTTFNEVSSLYFFDRDLRNICLKYLLKIESALKTTISYRFSEKFKGQTNPYFNLNNYTNDSGQTLNVARNIATLSNTISRKSKDKSINHYLTEYGTVPLWVLVNILTLGNINHFYVCLDDQLKNSIAEDFSKYFNDSGRQLNNQLIHLQGQDIEGILKITNDFRNVCAHEEILYNHVLMRRPKIRTLEKYLDTDLSSPKANLYVLLTMMRFYLSKEDCQLLFDGVEGLFKEYVGKIKTESVDFKLVLIAMGFNRDRPELFNDVLKIYG